MTTCSDGSLRSIFGIDSVAFYDLSDRTFYGSLKVLSGSTLALTGDTVPLNGGSSRFPYRVEDGLLNAEMTLGFKEYPDFLDEIFFGKAPTVNAAQAAGDVGNFANCKGSSILDVANGMDAVEATIGDEADLKFGKYVIVAKTAGTFDVYLSSGVDLGRGTAANYLDPKSLKIIEDGDISAGDFVSAEFGLTFGSVGTPAMVAGDTALFEVSPINTGSSEVTVGGLSDVFPSFGCILYAQKSSSGQLYEIDIFRAKALGYPINFTAQEFSESEITAQAYYCPVRQGVFSKRIIEA